MLVSLVVYGRFSSETPTWVPVWEFPSSVKKITHVKEIVKFSPVSIVST